jgi:hypothetical protein
MVIWTDPDLVDKPVSEQQVIASQILRESMRQPGIDRGELRELRDFLKQPLVARPFRNCETH